MLAVKPQIIQPERTLSLFKSYLFCSDVPFSCSVFFLLFHFSQWMGFQAHTLLLNIVLWLRGFYHT